jgi:tetratricopeptide (TPR) repeat protein
MSGIVRNVLRAAVVALCLGGMSTALAQEEWKSLSGEALWNQAAIYEVKHWGGEAGDALTKYLNEGAPAGRLAEARWRLARGRHAYACWTKDFSQFYALLEQFEREHASETGRIQNLRQLWTVVPVSLGDSAEGARRMQWYLETYPSAPEAALVKRDLAQKKWQDGDKDGAIADLEAVVAQNPNNPNLASVIGTLADYRRTRDGREASVALLEKALSRPVPLPESAPLHCQLASDYFNLKRYDEVATHTQYVLDNDLYGGQAHDAAKLRAWAEEGAGRPAQGLAYLEEVVRRYADTMPEFHHVIQERTDFQLRLVGPDAAIASLEAHVAAHPGLSSAGDAVYVLSRIVMKTKGPAAAVACLERFAAAYPGLRSGRDALFFLPDVYLMDGKTSAAMESCRKYVWDYPNMPDAEVQRNQEAYLLYLGGARAQAEKAGETRILGSKTHARRDVVPAYVLCATVAERAMRLKIQKKTDEAEKTLAYARQLFDIYFQLTDDEYVVYTLSLYLFLGEKDKAVDLATRYLAEHPDANLNTDWVRFYLASGRIGQFLTDRSKRDLGEKAAEILDDLRARQRTFSDKTLAAVLDYDPRLWPRVLRTRIMLAGIVGDQDAARECLLELRDKVPPSSERDRARPEFQIIPPGGQAVPLPPGLAKQPNRAAR